MAQHSAKSRFSKLKAIASKDTVSKSDTERMNKIADGTLSTAAAKKIVKG